MESSGEGSVTAWFSKLRVGDHAAARPLWERYFLRAARLARIKLRTSARRADADEEVAASAFLSLMNGAADGRFPRLDNRDDLWQVLAMLVCRKSINRIKRENAQKRGGAAVLDEADLDSSAAALDAYPGADRDPAMAVAVLEEYHRLLDSLGDADLRRIAVWKMEGYTHQEIAAMLECAPRTVDNKLKLIRKIWESS